MIKILKSEYTYLLLIVIFALILRLYKIDSPIADWHSWRQADTAAVTRNFIREGFNPLLPKFDDMSAMSETPLINTAGYRFVEFPIYNIFVYPLYLFFGVNEVYHRLVSVIFSLGSIIFLYLISKRYLGVLGAFLSAFIFAVLPFNVFFSRTTLPEPTLVFFSLGMVYFVERWIWDKKLIWGFIGLLFTSTAFLIKPWAVFFYIPLIYSAFKERGKIWPLPIKFIIFSIISVSPFILWRLWILQLPQGIPASGWLMNSDNIRFRPAFFWWLISERMGREILGLGGFVFFILGIILKPRRNLFLHVWLISMLSYFIIFATGNVRHNYYQLIFVPIASIFTALGIAHFFKGSKDFLPRIITIPIAILLLGLTIYFTFKIDKEFYNINNPAIVEAGKEADRILPETAVVVAPYNGDSAFLYQTNRRGFPFTPLPITEMITDYGVTHYISTTKDAKTNWILRHFVTLVNNESFVISDLTEAIKPVDLNDPEP